MFYKSVENMVIKQIVITTEKNRRNAMNYFKKFKMGNDFIFTN